MATATLWWYPGDEGALRAVNFLEGVSGLNDWTVVAGASAENIMGTIARVTWSGPQNVRLVLQDFEDAGLVREFRSLEGHLKAGLSVAFTADVDRAWAGFVESGHSVAAGSTTINTRRGHEFTAFTALPSLSSGDEVVLSSGAPDSWREWLEIDSVAGRTVNLTEAVRYEHDISPILVRHRDFWPVMVLDQDVRRPILSSRNQNSWTLDLTLREQIASYAALLEEGGEAIAGVNWNPGILDTTGPAPLDRVIGRWSVADQFGPGSAAWKTFGGGGS